MTLDRDRCRCCGEHAGEICERRDRCARHLALRSEPRPAYRDCASRLCYSGFSFFLEEDESS